MTSTDSPDPSGSSAAATITNSAMKPSSPSSVTSTPSPSSSSAMTAPMSSRKPPRKSTLTQQQKNNKRQRATQDQLVTLEMEFNKNPTPTAATRERIAQEINMTERSVQIWFQNRRAKIKMLAKKSIETGEGCDSIPESMRQYLAMQFDPTKPGARDPFGRSGAYDPSGVYPNESGASGKVVIHHFTCRSLTVGSWRRIGQNAMDLVVFYSPEKACMTYYINNDSAGYKIEYPFSYIKNITLESGDQQQPNGAPPPSSGGLVVELNHPPLFYMDSSNSGGFYQCSDFTEDQQASQIMVHHLGGHPKVLSVQLAKLVSLESFQNRMAYNNFPVPGPMSPHFIQRPASQPNHFAHPFLGVYQDNHLNVNMHAPRGHKRQRSRSVPVAVDFNAMQTPLNAYSMPQPQPQPPPQPQPAPQFNNTDSGIYAPVPQSVHPLAANLRIDTSAGYGMDLRGPPMSAATTASPSDFASPSLFANGPGEATPVAANVGGQFNLPYVSSAIESSNATTQAGTPYHNVGPADPLIADHSPPLQSMHPSQDIYGIGSEQQSTFQDDGMGWGEMFPKQNANFVPNAIGFEGNNLEVPMQGLSTHSSPLQGEYQSMPHPANGDQRSLASGS